MTNVISYSAYKTAKGAIDPLVADIIDALRANSGSAHRQDIANWIVGRRTGKPLKATPDEREAVYAAFEAYLDVAGRRRPPPLLCKPLGPDSYRWALTSAALDLFDKRWSGPAIKRAR
ncbi:hypothetical protein HZ989_13375 [Brevundimonas sp. AJA228-03]|uniref:hypothetical protein n=1 Tax=Brevundimonas sp. AJA228-03 TaxID=2752515 RepID=UPI001ADF8C0B|nr:hypothetical protein [Brevundimonas sp. AJA228-03]QTN19198.1 hypothetical protein HZ989_13375 [Brevundimonas sp. AJA228-03]